MRGNSHVRFGEEPRGNDPPRAPRRAAYSTPLPACPASRRCPGGRRPGRQRHPRTPGTDALETPHPQDRRDAKGLAFPGAAPGHQDHPPAAGHRHRQDLPRDRLRHHQPDQRPGHRAGPGPPRPRALDHRGTPPHPGRDIRRGHRGQPHRQRARQPGHHPRRRHRGHQRCRLPAHPRRPARPHHPRRSPPPPRPRLRQKRTFTEHAGALPDPVRRVVRARRRPPPVRYQRQSRCHGAR